MHPGVRCTTMMTQKWKHFILRKRGSLNTKKFSCRLWSWRRQKPAARSPRATPSLFMQFASIAGWPRIQRLIHGSLTQGYLCHIMTTLVGSSIINCYLRKLIVSSSLMLLWSNRTLWEDPQCFYIWHTSIHHLWPCKEDLDRDRHWPPAYFGHRDKVHAKYCSREDLGRANEKWDIGRDCWKRKKLTMKCGYFWVTSINSLGLQRFLPDGNWSRFDDW